MYRRNFIIALLMISALFFQTAPVSGQFDSISDKIAKELKEQNVPSISVAVARDGKIIWEEAFGWADIEKRIPATVHTPYSLASISKPITATGLMILVEENLIDLDKPVNGYLGEGKVNGRAWEPDLATIRRVMSHTAGLPLHYHFFYADEQYTKPPMDETIRRYGNLVTAPGERYQYSNLGYGIIDHVISRVSGRSYKDFMKERVFEPLGMTRTSVDPDPDLGEEDAVRYNSAGESIPFYDFDHPGASAVYSSAHDLVRFGMFHLKDRPEGREAIISDEAIDEMKTPVPPAEGYGLGWSEYTRGSVRRIAHSGGMGGVSTTLILLPDHDIVVTVLSNKSSRLPSTIAEDIIEALLPDEYVRTEPPERGNRGKFNPEEGLMGNWEGSIDTYNGEIPIKIRVAKPEKTSRVYVQLGDEKELRLISVSYRNGFLRGSFRGDLGTEDVQKYPNKLNVELKFRGDVLNGSVTAVPLPGKRVGNALSHWAELVKTDKDRR